MPVLNNKKTGFSRVCNGKIAVFWVLCCGITSKWALFSTIDYISISAHRSLKSIYNRLISVFTVKTAIEVKRQCVLASKKKTALLSGFLVSHRLFVCVRCK